MAFPKAKVKRFNEVDDCGPPVGTYDPKQTEAAAATMFLRSERFKNLADMSDSSLSSIESSAKKISCFKTPCYNKRPLNAMTSGDYVKVQECEKEIRRLLRERSDLLKQLTSKEEEMKKLEGRLQAALRDRSHFQANMATVDKEVKDLRRTNEILKVKVSTLESGNKKKDLRVELANLKAVLIEKEHLIVDINQELATLKREHENYSRKLCDKDGELSQVNREMASAITDLEEELERTKNQMNDLAIEKDNLVDGNEKISAELCNLEGKIVNYETSIKDLTQQRELLKNNLKEYRKDLELKTQLMNKTVDDLRNENMTLINRIEEQTNRRQSQEKFLSAELDNAYQKLGVTEDCSRALQEYRDVLVGRVTVLKDCVSELEEQQTLDMQTIKELKLELMEVTTRLADKEQALLDANTNITSLNDTITELKSVHDQLKNMTDKCIQLEDELDCQQSDHQIQVDKLEVEVLVTKLSYEAGEQELVELRQVLSEMQSGIDSEKDMCKKLQGELEQQKSAYEKKITELNDQVVKVENVCSAKCEETTNLESFIVAHSSKIKTLNKSLHIEIDKKDKLAEKLQRKLVLYNELNEQFEKTKNDKVALENALKSSNSILEELREETSLKISFLEDELAKEKSENLNMGAKMGELLFQNAALDEKVNDICQTLEVVNETVRKELQNKEELLSELGDKKDEVGKLEGTLVDLKGQLAESIVKMQSMELSKADLESKFENLVHKYDENVRICQEAEENLKRKSELAESLAAESEVIQGMFSQLYEERNNLEMEFLNLSRQLFNTTEELATREDKCRDLGEKLNAKSAEIQTLSEKLVEAIEKIQGLETSVASSEEQQDSLEASCRGLENQLLECRRNLTNVQQEMELQVATLSEHLEQVQKDKHESELLLVETKHLKDFLQGELNGTVQELNTLKSLLETNESEVADLQSEVDLLGNAIDEKAKTIDELNEELTRKQDELEILREQIAEKDDDAKTLAEKIVHCEAEALKYKNEACGLQDELARAAEEILQLKLCIESSESHISVLRDEVGVLTAGIGKKDEIICELNQDLAAKDEEAKSLRIELELKEDAIKDVQEEHDFLKESLELRYGEISELKTIIETNHQLMSEQKDNSIIEDLRSTTEQLDSLFETCQSQQQLITSIEAEKDDFKNRIKQLETDAETQSAQMQWLSDREKNLLRELDIIEEDAKLKQQEYIRALWETRKQCAQQENERFNVIREKEGRQNEEMLQSLTNEYEARTQMLSQHIAQLKKESLSWKTQFEELQAKVAPFQEQLDAFEIERNMMRSRTNETMNDFQKLSQQYATLLGHQNHKQKIQHVCKLKEEIITLKEDKSKLSAEVMKLKKLLQRREDGSIPSSARKFDPSKAFKHPNKENTLMECSTNTRHVNP